MKKPVLISDILRRSTNNESLGALNSVVVTRTCREVLGDTVCSFISDISYLDGKLTIRTSSAVLKNDLFMQRSQLMNKINEKLEAEVVKLVFVN